MKKIIVKEGDRSGLITLKDHETYHGETIWDDSIDGPIPAKYLGKERYLKRQNNTLVEDAAAKIISDKESADNLSISAVKSNLLAEIKIYDGNDVGSGAILLKVMEYLSLR